MFYSRQEQHELYRPVERKDAYNHITYDYELVGPIYAYIVKTDETTYRANELIAGEQFYTAYTQNSSVERDWVIDLEYKVQSVTPHRTGVALSLVLLER